MSGLRSKAHAEKRRKKRKYVIFIVPMILLVLIGLFVWYAWDSRFHIGSIQVTGASFVSKEAVVAEANAFIHNKLWGFIPKKSSALVGKGKLKKEIYEKFPPIKDLSVDIDNNVLHIDLKERLAAFIFCNAQDCSFMDETGFVFAPAPAFKGSSYIKVSSYSQVDESAIGKEVVHPEIMQTIAREIEVFKARTLYIQHVNIISPEELRLIDTHGIEYMISVQDEPQIIEERIDALLKAHPEVKDGGYIYIDMRIDGKIFLKKKES